MTISSQPVPANLVRPGMIDTAKEQTFPLSKAARKYASSRGERTIHPATLHRWRNPGINGIRLSCLKVGGIWHTSTLALQRFFEELTLAKEGQGPSGTEAAPRSIEKGRSARDADDRVEVELEKLLGGPSTPPLTKPPSA
jgi:hypothetical protein